MKLVSYTTKKKDRLGIFVDGKIYNLQECAAGLGIELPRRMRRFLRGGDEMMDNARKVETAIKEGKITSFVPTENLRLLAPIPNPPSCRDGYAFRQHVATARRNRGVEMIPEFDQYPVFYLTNFTNSSSVPRCLSKAFTGASGSGQPRAVPITMRLFSGMENISRTISG
mgnify:CR=1 FL=1